MAFTDTGGFPIWNRYYNEPFFSSDVFRYNTGGASSALRGTASDLANSNIGTQYANLMRQAAERGSSDDLRRMTDNSMAAGGAGNYNAMSGIASNIGQSRNTALTGAYAKGAEINQQARAQGGNLYAKADELDQAGKRDSLNYISRFRPEQIDPGNLRTEMGLDAQGNATSQQLEGFLPGLLKGVLTGGLGSLAGGAFGLLGDKLFGFGRGEIASPYEYGGGTPGYGAYSPWGYEG